MAEPKPAQGGSTGQISDEAVRAKTGRTPSEWFEILDREGAQKMPHREIAEIVYGKYEIDGWWAQMVTVAYERERGLRDKHQKPDGYEISGSKTLPVPLETLFAAWQDETVRGRWLGEPGLTVRKATPNKSMRVTWPDQTRVEVNFYAKGEAKSQVAVQHGKLPDAEAAARRKAWWAEALERLRTELGG
jgi:hypothetical protein